MQRKKYIRKMLANEMALTRVSRNFRRRYRLYSPDVAYKKYTRQDNYGTTSLP